MTGSKSSLNVILGKKNIATLSVINDQLTWDYTKNWQQSGYAVSPHLPLQGNIPSLNIERFLKNLLPEGHLLDELIACFVLSKNNTLGLVRALGLDISGALIMLPPTQTLPQIGTFRKIEEKELKDRLDRSDDLSLLIWDGKPRLSVAGVQDKINVVLAPNGEIGFGEGSLCSTHILKFEKKKLPHLALNEFITMQLAKECGLKVANIELKYFGKHTTLLVERFDRHFISMKEIKRRHVIDGCQALNIPPEHKYERNFGSTRDVAHIREGASYRKLFEFANKCTNPALTKQKILDWALFNILVFNHDAHGKNISFFVGESGISLTPFYDLVNIKMYPQFEQEMAMALGDEFDSNTVNAYQLADFAQYCQLTRTLVAKRLSFLIGKLKNALDQKGHFYFKNIEEKDYFKQYQHIVYERCEQALGQIPEINSIIL